MILIDMPMPEKCSECRFETECGFCKAMPEDFCGYTDDIKKPEWCPLISMGHETVMVEKGRDVEMTDMEQATVVGCKDVEIEPICKIVFDIPYYFCGNCQTMLNMYGKKANYCSECGCAVNWNDGG